MRHVYGGIIAASLLVLGACGGDDDDSSSDDGGSETTEAGDSGGGDNEYVQALSESMVEGQDDIPLEEETATCVAGAVVDLVGVDTLRDADITPEEFADAESFGDLDLELPDDATTQLGQSMSECDLAEAMRPVVVEQFAAEAGDELPADATACLEENIDNQAAADALAAAFIEGSQGGIETMITDALLACPDVSTALILSETGEVPPEAQACVRDFVEANPDLARAAFVERDQAAAEDLGVQLAGACPAAFGGG